MTPSQWQRVRDLFESVVDHEPSEARRLVAAADDGVVRAEVLSLLEHHSQAGDFMEAAPAFDDLAGAGMELSPGTVLGQYTIVDELGQGGMGRVYLASDSRLQRLVCLKAVRADLTDPTYRVRLQREARTAASLAHPGICAVYAFEEFDGQSYLVTEYINGHTLRREIDAAERPDANALTATMTQLAQAVGAAHVKGIVHRDLKPENIMRTSEGGLKVLDFGVARVERPHGMPATVPRTLPGTLVGTVAYMAPEQLNGEPLDARADVFALGVVMYELATGVHPFAAPNALTTAARVLAHDPEPLRNRRPDLPVHLVAIIERCLAKAPHLRWESGSDLAKAIAHPSEMPRGGVPVRTWWRWHQVVALVLYVCGAALAWQIKEWEPVQTTGWLFLATGVLTSIAGVVRGHLLFLDRVHPRRLVAEWQRTRGASLGLDLGLAVVLVVDGGLLAASHPLVGVLVMGLGAGIGTAAVFIEPSTSRAALDVP
jgi:hypothetical protein